VRKEKEDELQKMGVDANIRSSSSSFIDAATRNTHTFHSASFALVHRVTRMVMMRGEKEEDFTEGWQRWWIPASARVIRDQ
jgi:hypothetical protein